MSFHTGFGLFMLALLACYSLVVPELRPFLAVVLLVFALNSLVGRWAQRRRMDRWLQCEDNEGIVCGRPVAERLLALLLAAGVAWLMGKAIAFVSHACPDSAARHNILTLVLTPLGLLLGLFVVCTGPRRLRLDARRREYVFTHGFPLFPRTSRGTTEGAEVRMVSHTSKGRHSVWFRAPGWRRSVPVEWFGSEEQARALAERMAARFGLGVRQA